MIKSYYSYSEIAYQVYRFSGEQPLAQFGDIEPLERRVLYGSIVQIEPVYIDVGAHLWVH